MAGPKESPRQQMINLMYLVLTALLALQVSSSIIDKFLFLSEALENSAEKSKTSTDLAVKAFVDKAIKEGEDKEQRFIIRKKAIDEVEAKTDELVKYIDELKRQMIIEAGDGLSKEDPSRPENPMNETKVETFMLGQKRASELKSKLKQYTAAITDIVRKVDKEYSNYEVKDLAVDYVGKGEDKKKTFEDRSFGQTPVAASMSVLSYLKNEVRTIEADAVKKLGVNEVPPSPDVYVPDFSLESAVVATGQKIKGKMFLFATSQKVPVSASLNGNTVPNNSQGVAEFEIPAGGAGKHVLNGEIRTKIKGKDTVFRFTKEYQVVQPNILVENPNLIALYEGCGNELNVSVPELGASYNPSFAGTSGATVITTGEKTKVVVVPNEGVKEVNLSVSSGGTPVGTRKFGVKPVPYARLGIMSGGSELNLARGLNSRLGGNVSVQVIPDPNFKQSNPKDASYSLDNANIELKSAGRTVATAKGTANIASMLAKAKPGDVLIIEALGVKRTNFRGQVLPARVANPVLVVPLN